MPYFQIDEFKDIGHPPNYYIERDVVFDGRGDVHISHLSNWGVSIVVITASHNPDNFSEVVYRPVTVRDYAWICSCSLLYNCDIGLGAIVAAGTVVRSRDVPDWTMVEGNPARIIAHYIDGTWVYCDDIPLDRKK